MSFKKRIREKLSAVSIKFQQSITISALSGHTAKPFVMYDLVCKNLDNALDCDNDLEGGSEPNSIICWEIVEKKGSTWPNSSRKSPKILFCILVHFITGFVLTNHGSNIESFIEFK